MSPPSVVSPTGSGVTSPPVLTETLVFFPRNFASTTPPGAPTMFSGTGLRRHGSQSQRDRDRDRDKEREERERTGGERERERTVSVPKRRASMAKVDGGNATTSGVGVGVMSNNTNSNVIQAVQVSPRTQRYRSRRGSYVSPVGGTGVGVGVGVVGGSTGVGILTHSAGGNLSTDFSGMYISGGGGGMGGVTSAMSTTSETIAIPNASNLSNPSRPRLSRSPSSHNVILPGLQPGGAGVVVPAELKDLLDGTRHTDELGVRFEVGWPSLEKYLVAIGGGKGEGDFGKVEIIYR